MCIPKIAFMGAVVKISYEKNDFCHFSVKKWTGRGTVELLKMGYVTFFYQNPFLYPYRCFSQMGSTSDKLSPPLLITYYFCLLEQILFFGVWHKYPDMNDLKDLSRSKSLTKYYT